MKFRKKPVVIEAVLVSELVLNAKNNWAALPSWVKDRYEQGGFVFLADGISVGTLEGTMKAELSDYLICGVKGEIYPCKPDVFEQTYDVVNSDDIDTKSMNFGQAIEALKEGKLVTREGWNGKGMFVFMRPADELPVGFVAKDIKSLPQSVKDYYNQDCVDENGNPVETGKDDVVKFTQYLCMKSVDGVIVNGWLATQSDMLSEDWMIFEY